MKHDGFEYEVKPVLELTEDEARGLCAMANGHYDRRCQSFAQRDGLLRGLVNQFENKFDNGTGVIKKALTLREIDTLLKVIEQEQVPSPKKWFALKAALLAGSAEQARLNAKETPDDPQP